MGVGDLCDAEKNRGQRLMSGAEAECRFIERCLQVLLANSKDVLVSVRAVRQELDAIESSVEGLLETKTALEDAIDRLPDNTEDY
jgi:cell division protein FtsB